MLFYCRTDKIIALVGFLNSEKVLMFPSQNVQFPGLHLENKALVPVHDLILSALEKFCGVDKLKIKFECDEHFAEPVNMGKEEATLYLCKITKYEEMLPRYLYTFPSLLKGMNKDRSRLPYLKALQVMTGAREQQIRAVETNEKLN